MQKLVKLRITILMLVIYLKKTDYEVKISDIEGKNFAIADYNKFTSDILRSKKKQKELVNKSNISNISRKKILI